MEVTSIDTWKMISIAWWKWQGCAYIPVLYWQVIHKLPRWKCTMWSTFSVNTWHTFYGLAHLTSENLKFPQVLQSSNWVQHAKCVLLWNAFLQLVLWRCWLHRKFDKNSSKTTCAISLFQSGVGERLIMVQTGHCSDAYRAGCGAFQHFWPPAQTKPLLVKNEAACMGSKPPITWTSTNDR